MYHPLHLHLYAHYQSKNPKPTCFSCDSVPVCSGCHNKIPYTGWQFWRLGSPRLGCLQIQCLVRTCFLVNRQTSCYVLTEQKVLERCLWSLWCVHCTQSWRLHLMNLTPKAPSPNTTTSGFFNIGILDRHKHPVFDSNPCLWIIAYLAQLTGLNYTGPVKHKYFFQ